MKVLVSAFNQEKELNLELCESSFPALAAVLQSPDLLHTAPVPRGSAQFVDN